MPSESPSGNYFQSFEPSREPRDKTKSFQITDSHLTSLRSTERMGYAESSIQSRPYPMAVSQSVLLHSN